MVVIDTSFYKNADVELADQLLVKCKNEESAYLSNFQRTTRYFYGLPKVHTESEYILNATKLQNSK